MKGPHVLIAAATAHRASDLKARAGEELLNAEFAAIVRHCRWLKRGYTFYRAKLASFSVCGAVLRLSAAINQKLG
jgi:hypothetical protein